MTPRGAQTPRENIRRPTFSWTIQCSPAAFTRRVRAASPGGNSIQPAGTGSAWPDDVRTVLGVGPGRYVGAGMAKQVSAAGLAVVERRQNQPYDRFRPAFPAVVIPGVTLTQPPYCHAGPNVRGSLRFWSPPSVAPGMHRPTIADVLRPLASMPEAGRSP